MHKIRVFTYIILVLLSWAPSRASLTAKVEASEADDSAAEQRRHSAILGQEDLKGKVIQTEEPLLSRSMIIPSQLRTPIDTRLNKVGDLITVETKEDLLLSDEVIVPAGSYLKGYISKLEKPGRMMKDPKIEVDFNTVYIAGQKEQIHILAKLKAKQLIEKSSRVSDGATYKSKATKTALVGGVLGASGAYAATQMLEPFATFGISGMLNNLLILGSGAAGVALGMSLITKDEARIESGTSLDIMIEEASKPI